MTEIPTDCADENDSSANPIVNWLAKRGVKTKTVIFSEYHKKMKNNKEQRDGDFVILRPNSDTEQENYEHVSRLYYTPVNYMYVIDIICYGGGSKEVE